MRRGQWALGLVALAAAPFLAFSCLPAAAPAGAVFADAPVVIVSIDTLRADHLPAYGYRGVATPAIDALARDAIVFENAYSPVPLTLPAHLSLLSGHLPPIHGVRDNLGYDASAAAEAGLPGLLRKRGYATGAAVSSHVLHRSTGIDAGFDFFEDEIGAAASRSAASAQRAGSETARHAMDWMAGLGDRPFLLLLHLYEPHSPYDAPEPFRSRYPEAPYDAEIAAADDVVGSVIAFLKKRGVYERALVVLLSDHGEGLNDHGEEHHGILLYRESLHVPLMVKLPGGARAGERVSRPVGLADVMPAIVSAVGGQPPAGLSGRSLLDAASGGPVYSETFYPRIHLGWSELRSLIDERYHYVDGPRPELFDIVKDPGERDNLLARDPARAAALRAALDEVRGAYSTPQAVSAEQAERLAALGYISSGAPEREGPRPDPRDKLPVLADVQAAFRASAAGRDEEAARLLQRVLDGNPGFFDVQYQLAETLARLGRHEEAYRRYREAMATNPALAGPTGLALARVCLELGRHAEAEANARLGLETNPPRAHELIARAALGLERLEDAERHALLVAGDPATEAAAAVIRAEVRIRRNDPAAALDVVDSALRRLPADTSVRDIAFIRGDALARLSRYPEARAAFEAEVARFPDNAPAYARLAIVLAVAGRPAREVHDVLERMVRANPGRASALLAARTLESIGDRPLAAAYRRRAL